MDTLMALTTILALIIGPLVALGLAALRFGVDSRDGITDDHVRGAAAW